MNSTHWDAISENLFILMVILTLLGNIVGWVGAFFNKSLILIGIGVLISAMVTVVIGLWVNEQWYKSAIKEIEGDNQKELKE